MALKTNVAGVWKDVTPWVNVGGVWKKMDAYWVNVGGVWKKIYPAFAPQSFSITAGIWAGAYSGWYTFTVGSISPAAPLLAPNYTLYGVTTLLDQNILRVTVSNDISTHAPKNLFTAINIPAFGTFLTADASHPGTDLTNAYTEWNWSFASKFVSGNVYSMTMT